MTATMAANAVEDAPLGIVERVPDETTPETEPPTPSAPAHAHEHVAARIGRIAGTWFPLVVLGAGAVAVLVPAPFLPLGALVNPLLMVIMLGMGMTLRGSDFAIVARKPFALAIGIVAQFVVMPLTGFLLVTVLDLDPAIAVGVILVAAAPGGTASNVMVFLAKGDTALSVAMTTVSTLVAPVLTPLLVLLLASRDVPVDPVGLFVSIVQIVIVPIVVGLLLRRFLPRFVAAIVAWMPLVSVVGITLVVLAVVSGSAATIIASGLAILGIVVVLNGVGLVLGYLAARAVGLEEPARRAVSIEVGMQNSGLAAGLARTHFTAEAAVPAAIFSVWHNVSGALLASFWSRRPPREAEPVAHADSATPR